MEVCRALRRLQGNPVSIRRRHPKRSRGGFAFSAALKPALALRPSLATTFNNHIVSTYSNLNSCHPATNERAREYRAINDFLAVHDAIRAVPDDEIAVPHDGPERAVHFGPDIDVGVMMIGFLSQLTSSSLWTPYLPTIESDASVDDASGAANKAIKGNYHLDVVSPKYRV